MEICARPNRHLSSGKPMMARARHLKKAAIPFLALILAACTVGPDYTRPSITVPVAYKEMEGWKKAEPQDQLPRGSWWEIFNDPKLNELEEQVDISNQNIAAAEAQLRQALAVVKAARAGYFPTLSVGSSTSRSGKENTPPVSSFSIDGTISWELDLWGRVRRTVESSQASAEASAADLENVRLLAHAQLAQLYLQLRTLDTQKQVLDTTTAHYEKFLQLTKNRYGAGVASKADVLQAETQLRSAQSQSIETGIQRSQYEHAIAVLIGKSPSELSIPVSPLDIGPPSIPTEVPSELLERRPDIAAAERSAAAANAQIGVAVAAYYPSLSLSSSGGFQATDIAKWLTWPSAFWVLGPASLHEVIFDAGLRSAQTEQARAAFEARAASYRQAVLAGFQQVEDFLASLRILEHEAEVQALSLTAARQSLEITTNRYMAGLASALDVIVTQNITLGNELANINILGRRMIGSVQLIEALGGGWSAWDRAPADNEGRKH